MVRPTTAVIVAENAAHTLPGIVHFSAPRMLEGATAMEAGRGVVAGPAKANVRRVDMLLFGTAEVEDD